MTGPEDIKLNVEAVNQVKTNAAQLGLQWELKYATVLEVDDGVIQAIFDGDVVPVWMISLIGSTGIAEDDRIAVISVPPNGNYVVGAMTGALVAGRVGCTLQRISPSQTLPDVINTTVLWNSALYDSGGMWDSGDPTKINITAEGVWTTTATVAFAAGTGGRSFIEIVVVSLPSGPYWRGSIGPNGEDTGVVSATFPLPLDEQIIVNVFRDGAAATSMTVRVDCYLTLL